MPRILAPTLCATVLVMAAPLLTGCPSSTLPPPINVAVGIQADYVTASAALPYALAAAADGRVFYTEKNTGLIRVVENGTLLSTPFASLPVNFADDRGLLGITLDPNFNLNGRVYVFYTRSDTGQPTSDPRAAIDNRVVYLEAADNGNVATSGEVFVLSLPIGLDTTRIGGALGFAPDFSLYVGLGDTTDQDAAQLDFLPFGKILRYNGDGTIPADNPDPNSAVFARGLCDPRTITFDPNTGVAFVVDRNVGGGVVYEIDRILAGKNYGWPVVTGTAGTSAERTFAAQDPNYEDPLLQSTTDGFAGVGFNPGTKYGAKSRLLLMYGLIQEGKIMAVTLTPDRTGVSSTAMFAQHFPVPLSNLTFTPAGTLYVASSATVVRLVLFE